MRTTSVLRLAGAACVGVLAACAAEPAPAPASRASSEASSATPTDAATVVRLEVTGGIAGVHRVYELTRDARPRGLSPRAARTVLRLAGHPTVRGLDDTGLAGAVPCCDRQVVDVTVVYADGDRTRLRAVGTASMPPQLRRMVALLSSAA